MEKEIKVFLSEIGEERLIKENILTSNNTLNNNGAIALIKIMKEMEISKLYYEDKWYFTDKGSFFNTFCGNNEPSNILESNDHIFNGLSDNKMINPFYCPNDIVKFFKNYEEEIKKRKILQGPKNDLNDNSIIPLLKLMKENKIETLEYFEYGSLMWSIGIDFKFVNDYAGYSTPTNILDGNVFDKVSENTNFNIFYAKINGPGTRTSGHRTNQPPQFGYKLENVSNEFFKKINDVIETAEATFDSEVVVIYIGCTGNQWNREQTKGPFPNFFVACQNNKCMNNRKESGGYDTSRCKRFTIDQYRAEYNSREIDTY